MKLSPTPSSFFKKALLALGCTALLSLTAATALNAADAPAAASAAALPVGVKIEKVTGAEKPYVAHLTNESKSSLKVSAKVLLAVAFHGEDRARHIPAQTIEAGKEWSINELAFDD